MKTEGMIYGIGVGIGDPEDITLKAVRCIEESDILILPAKDPERCRAYQIAKKAFPQITDIDTMALEFEMVRMKVSGRGIIRSSMRR
jgi:Precorrin-2 methylase